MIGNRHYELSSLAFAFLLALTTIPAVALDKLNPASPVRGKQVFEKATCAACHPGGGNTINREKPIKGATFAREFQDDQKLVEVIRKGVKGTAMPGFDPRKISDAEMRDLVSYIRTLTPAVSRRAE